MSNTKVDDLKFGDLIREPEIPHNFGNSFTMSDVTNIMLAVEQATLREACEYLIELGYGDTFYDASEAFSVERYMRMAIEAGVEEQLAQEFGDITFQGGPKGEEWFTLNFQCLLEDHVAQCICVYGAAMVSRCLGLVS